MPIQCWPYGHDTRKGDCDAEIPDLEYETMKAHGWGWTFARDDGAASGEGMFAACPDHRDDRPTGGA